MLIVFKDLGPICEGRTILTSDNIYSKEVVQVASSDASTKCAVAALSSSYYKDYLQSGSPDRSRVEKLEMKSLRSALVSLKGDGPERDTALMLIIHHAIINPMLHQLHWTEYTLQSQHHPAHQSNVVIAAHFVWLMAILPLNDSYAFQRHDYRWLGVDSPSFYMVNSILGQSRQMLYHQYLIAMEAKKRVILNQQDLPYPLDIIQIIENSPQF